MLEVSGVFQPGIFSFSSEKRKQPGKLMAKSRPQSVNLPSAWPLMNPLTATFGSCGARLDKGGINLLIELEKLKLNQRI